jgi:hypothetical protein
MKSNGVSEDGQYRLCKHTHTHTHTYVHIYISFLM